MSASTVFSVADSLIKESGQHSLPSVTLQKLCFYSYAWYAHLTGDELFPEETFAMPKGPVVGELLSAHAGKTYFSEDDLKAQFSVREIELDIDPFAKQVISSVWKAYGSFSRWDLVEMTHVEPVWKQPWDERSAGSKRAPMPVEFLLDYFSSHTPQREIHFEEKIIKISADFPPRLVFSASEESIAALLAVESIEHKPFVSRIRTLSKTG